MLRERGGVDQHRLEIAPHLLDLTEGSVDAPECVADAPVGGRSDLGHFAYHFTPEACHLTLCADQHVFARGLDLAGQVATRGGHLLQHRRQGGLDLGGNGPRQRTRGPRCGVEEEDGLYCHRGQGSQQGSTQSSLQPKQHGWPPGAR